MTSLKFAVIGHSWSPPHVGITDDRTLNEALSYYKSEIDKELGMSEHLGQIRQRHLTKAEELLKEKQWVER